MTANGRESGLEAMLAAALARRPDDEELEAARLRAGDVACAVELGRRLPEWGPARRAFARLGRPASGLAAAGELSACCRLTEIDDIHLASCTTPGAVAVPAALAAALAGAATPAALEGIVVGYEVAVRAGEIVGGALAPPGTLWATRAVAPLAAAAAAARALGLSAEESLHACAIAAGAQVVGTMPEPGRSFSLAIAVRSGMEAAAAAAEGLQGNRGSLAAWPSYVAGAAAEAPSVRRAGVLESRLKPYAAARQVLAASAGLRALVEAGEVRPGDVTSLEVQVPPLHGPMVDRPLLSRRLDTLASAQFQLSLALEAPGQLDELDHPLPAASGISARMGTVSVRGADDLGTGFPRRWAARLVLRGAGCERRIEVEAVAGEEGFGWDDLAEKASRLASANGGGGERLAGLLGQARDGNLAVLAEELVASLDASRKGATT